LPIRKDCSKDNPPFGHCGEKAGNLVGRRIQWYYEGEEPSRLELKCDNGRVQILERDTLESWEDGSWGDNDEPEAEICMDEQLEDALESLRGQRGKSLCIEEAALGQRESRVTSMRDTHWRHMKHRVIGIRLDGMTDIGFIYGKGEMDGDYDDKNDLENYNLIYCDIVVAQHYKRYAARGIP
jgi:hypothetical protein